MSDSPPDGPPIVHATPVYRIGRFLSSAELLLLHRRRVECAERLPREGGVLIVANHQSFLDIPLVASATSRHVCFVARDTLAKSRFLAFVMRHCGAVLVRRGQSDRAAVRSMVAHLQAGDVVAVYPEGTRTKDGSLGEFRGGALLAARLAKVPVVPVGIRGTFEALSRSAKFPSPARVAVRFGAPLEPDAPDALERARSAIQEMVGEGRFDSVAAV